MLGWCNGKAFSKSCLEIQETDAPVSQRAPVFLSFTETFTVFFVMYAVKLAHTSTQGLPSPVLFFALGFSWCHFGLLIS